MVSFYRVEKYDVALIKAALEKAIEDAGGMAWLLAKGKKVVIKPNLVVKKAPEGCATTHPAVVEAMLQILLPHTNDITVAECPGGPNTEGLLAGIYRGCGIKEVCDRYGVPISFDMTAVALPVKDGIVVKEVELLKTFAEADVFINLTKMKTHSLTTCTGAAKNLYGAVPGLRKVEFHARFPKPEDFAALILDINRALVPTFSVIDGIWGMEKEGPSGGEPKFAGALLAGTDTLEMDFAEAAFMGIDPDTCPILARAKKEGRSDGTFTVTGDDFEASKPTPFILPNSRKSVLVWGPNLFGGRLAALLSPHPVIETKICRGCGECARLCPQKTIEMKNGKAHIIRKNCIRCYCCQEMCPARAVKTKSLKVFGI